MKKSKISIKKIIEEIVEKVPPFMIVSVIVLLWSFSSFRNGEHVGVKIMFFHTPLLVGALIYLFSRDLRTACMRICKILFFGSLFLLALCFEGLVCVLMALPILFIAMNLGAFLAFLSVQLLLWVKVNYRNSINLTIVLFSSVFFVGSQRVETSVDEGPGTVIVKSEIEVMAPREKVWKHIENIDLVGDPPLLMKLGLPLPLAYSLVSDGEDGEQILYFDQEVLNLAIDHWDYPSHFEVSTSQKIGGRDWLTLRNAGYHLHPTENGTKVIFYTEQSSTLQPRIYWERIERLCTLAVHQFILENIKEQSEML